MKIVLFNKPNIWGIPGWLTELLYTLTLEVDISFAADGYYHVRSEDLIRALLQEGYPQAAASWKYKIERKRWSHVMIPADCCRMVLGQTESIGAQPYV